MIQSLAMQYLSYNLFTIEVCQKTVTNEGQSWSIAMHRTNTILVNNWNYNSYLIFIKIKLDKNAKPFHIADRRQKSLETDITHKLTFQKCF